MSFSMEVKNEICRIENITREEAVSLLSAVMKSSGTLRISENRRLSFSITSENSCIARLVFKLFKEYFNIHTKLIIKKNNTFKKNNTYMVIIPDNVDVKRLLIELYVLKTSRGIIEIDYSISNRLINNDKKKRAYIRGAFLGGGSISDPKKTYHFEFITHNEQYANELSTLINKYDITSKIIERKGSYVIYVKEGEQIIDLLNIIGAHNCLFSMENVRIVKEMRNNVNRLVNCETANLSKTVNASVRQVECIRLIEKTIGLKRLSENLREIAELRLDNPDESLKELGQMLNPNIGKSGINHRLRNIEKIADEIRKEQEYKNNK